MNPEATGPTCTECAVHCPANGDSYVHSARFPSTSPRPMPASARAAAGHRPVAVWQADLRERIRHVAPIITERERALMGLVWLEIELCDELPANTVQWTLHCLDTLVGAIEAEEAPSETEPP